MIEFLPSMRLLSVFFGDGKVKNTQLNLYNPTIDSLVNHILRALAEYFE